ncbi:MAG TPA: hypothetical protein VEG84_04605 [Thermoanaerobaculia bacterium]|nr:hypothetical protein [Thermoanaerobaculia bacterium]
MKKFIYAGSRRWSVRCSPFGIARSSGRWKGEALTLYCPDSRLA